LPALDKDAVDVITGSEHILKAYADKHSLTATAIVDLIKNVLKNPEFNTDDVDTDMLQRLQAAIDSGDLQVMNMNKDGDGPQVLELQVFARPVEKVLRELISDLRLARCYPFNIQGRRFRNKNPQVHSLYRTRHLET
jgi:hypothetical protein